MIINVDSSDDNDAPDEDYAGSPSPSETDVEVLDKSSDTSVMN